MELHNEKSVFIAARGKTILDACPGSGKTTAIVAKAHSLIQSWNELYPAGSGVALISFTNVAKDEIQTKFYKKYGEYIAGPHVISTIDSFINKYITLPFFNSLFPGAGQRPTIVDDSKFLDNFVKDRFNSFIRHKDCALTPDTIKNIEGLIHRYNPSEFDFGHNKIVFYKGKPVSDENVQLVAKLVKRLQAKSGMYTSSDSAYCALQILRGIKRIPEYLSRRFPHVIIDEAQDTSEVQFLIFSELIDSGLKNIDVVGDPMQALYEFRQARPEIFFNSQMAETNWNILPLKTNFRSTRNIITAFSMLRNSASTQIEPFDLENVGNVVEVVRYNSDTALSIALKYMKRCENRKYESYNILVRGVKHLKLFSGTQDPIELWKSPLAYELIASIDFFLRRDIKVGINLLRKLYVKLKYPELDYKIRKEKTDEMKSDCSINTMLFQTMEKLPTLIQTAAQWTEQLEKLITAQFELNEPFSMKIKSYRKIDRESGEKSIVEVWPFVQAEESSLVKTIHSVKGKTIDSVMIVLNENAKGDSISLREFTKTEEITEHQRMLYVAMSRPAKELILAIPDSIEEAAIASAISVPFKVINAAGEEFD